MNMSVTIRENDDILYCKARGMPFDHVDGNAILSFPDRSVFKVHGAELECSHPACRSHGSKFRYCTICKIAVSKRNFRKRHAHGLSFSTCQVRKQLTDVTSSYERQMDYFSMQQQYSSETIRAVTNDSTTFFSHCVIASNRSKKLRLPSPRNPFESMSTCGKRQAILENGNESMLIIPEDWMTLYREKPKAGDTEGIKQWLISAMNIAGLTSCIVDHVLDTTISATSANSCWRCDDSDFDPVAVKDEFLANIPPMFSCLPSPKEQVLSVPRKFLVELEDNHNDMDLSTLSCSQCPKYKQFAETMSLQVETNSLGVEDMSDIIPLDSEGSSVRTYRM